MREIVWEMSNWCDFVNERVVRQILIQQEARI